MEGKHYKDKISAFLNHELSCDEHRAVGEHILHCKECRQEHDQVKQGADFAQILQGEDAPDSVWKYIEASIDDTRASAFGRESNLFHWRKLSFGFVSIAIFLSLTLGLYLYVFDSNRTEQASGTKKSGVLSSWRVKNISGKSRITNSVGAESLRVGSTLETDAVSSAKIDVADIGHVEVAPNSLVKLVNSTESEHRLSLERGKLSARIYAPPRLFVVDTPSAVAVDLGCAYDLDVDEAGDSRLHVTSGYVALEREGLESIVPAGAICYTKRGKGLGTPFSESASPEFQKELRKFDFHDGGTRSLAKILELAKAKDTLTLWHLISRVSGSDRTHVLDKTLTFANLPEGVTRKGILRLDKNMLEKLRYELENFWYG